MLENADSPCQVESTAETVPLLLSYIAMRLSITFLVRRMHFTSSDSGVVIVFTFNCMRSNTHGDHGSDSYRLLGSLAWGDSVTEKKRRRPAPSVSCNCPWCMHVRIFIPSNVSDVSSHALSDFKATIEFPKSPGWHGKTHDPIAGADIKAGGVSVTAQPVMDGEALDSYHHPYHPDALRLLVSLCRSDVDATSATLLVQNFMTWLRPQAQAQPDVIASALPHRILASSGIAPLVVMANGIELLAADESAWSIISRADVNAELSQLGSECGDSAPCDTPEDVNNAACESQSTELAHEIDGNAIEGEMGILASEATKLSQSVSAAANAASITAAASASSFTGGRPIPLSQVLRMNLRGAMSFFRLRHAHSCFGWIANDRVVSSLFQWGTLITRVWCVCGQSDISQFLPLALCSQNARSWRVVYVGQLLKIYRA